MNKTEYAEALKRKEWQEKRKVILYRDANACRHCNEVKSSLHVHHRYYLIGKMPWEYPDDALITLCADCHAKEHERCKPRQFKDLASVRKREAKGITVDGVPKKPAKPKKEKKKKEFETAPPQVGPRNPIKEKNLPRRYRIRKAQVCYTCGKTIKKRAWAIHHWWVKPTTNAYDHLYCYKGQYTEPTKQDKKPK